MLGVTLLVAAGLIATLHSHGNFKVGSANVLQATSPRSTNCAYVVNFRRGSTIEESSVEKWIARYQRAYGMTGTIRATGVEEATETNDGSFRLARLRALALRRQLLNFRFSTQQISTFFYKTTIDTGSIGYIEYCLAPQCFCFRKGSGATALQYQVEFDPDRPD